MDHWCLYKVSKDLMDLVWFCHRERQQYLGVREARTESDCRRANAATAAAKDTEQHSEQPFWSSISGRFGSTRSDIWNVFCRYVVNREEEIDPSFPFFLNMSCVSLARVSEVVEKRKRKKKKKKKIDGKEISSLHWISFSCEKFPIDYLLGLIHKRVLPLNFTFRCTVFHGYLIIIHTCIYIYLYIHT